ncbi:hypothetical protein FBU30_001723 [Linnemannia zychae]|nr:hypothetical protein FBU30_001723 [Linnemannia zychae]
MTASDIVFAQLGPPEALLLPELLTIIATHLDVPDIFQCIQVCRTWNRLFIPYLWLTFDDSSYRWPEILIHHDSDSPPEGKGKNWIFALFAKYGHHIRHLHIRWRIILDAAGSGRNCTRLQSLSIHDMTKARTSDEQAEDARLWTLEFNSRSAADRACPGAVGPILSSEFDGVFEPAPVHLRSLAQQNQDWITHQKFWLLVRQNPGLHTLRSHWSLLELACVKNTEFFYETLALLPNIREIDNQIVCVDFGRFLDQVPNLRRYNAAYSYMDNVQLTTSFQSLQMLRMPGFRRLDKDEHALYLKTIGHDPDLASISDFHEEHQALMDKALLCKLQHVQVYDQLALLTRLEVLDLGFEARNVYLSTRASIQINYPANRGANAQQRQDLASTSEQAYLDYGGPHRETMRLTLNSGLDRLRSLVNLRVFGFEGVDHGIGEAELEWMAAHWPKLKVMRGLQEDTLPRIRPDERKTELRLHMCKLRPNVRHEGTTPETDD